jgi:ribosomal protein S18 acetylase RimI-like enzyme
MPALVIRPFRASDEAAVIGLWNECGLLRPWNDPSKDIARKLAKDPELFLVGSRDEVLVASAMFGYDGHRGTVYYLAVAKAHRQVGLGRRIMSAGEALLRERGCPKLNLLVRTSNTEVLEFYGELGYGPQEVTCLGKRLIED